MTTANRLGLHTPMSRRRALQVVGASVLATALIACGDEPAERRSFWAQVAASARLQDRSLTLATASAELDQTLTADRIRLPSRTLHEQLEERIRGDFAAGRTMLVTGWLLARTEVLLAVIVEADER